MNRKLFIIIDHGTDPVLKGVDRDKTNYLTFFKSNYGGAWEDNEKEVFEDNFSLSKITVEKLKALRKQTTLDYILIVFCGHGGETPDGVLYYEFKPNNINTLYELRHAVKGIRCLFIADSCRGIERFADGGRIGMFSAVIEAVVNDYERQVCKDLYNNAIMQVPQGTFTAGFAASSGQYAKEGQLGGYYSSALLKTADSEIQRLDRIEHRYPDNEIVSFTSVHQIATDIVSAKTSGDQIPDYVTIRHKSQYPLIVYPDYQRLLP